MKSNLAKVSFALFFAVFILGCQDLGTGPVGADGLVPQFGKPDCGTAATHPSCKPPDDDEPEVPRYAIILSDDLGKNNDIFSVGADPYVTDHHLGAVIVTSGFQMDITAILAFQKAVTCGGAALTSPLTGRFSLTSFAIPQLLLFFRHNEVDHWIESLSDVGENWVPTEGKTVMVSDVNGQWEIKTRGKKNQNGCTGEGGGIGGANPISWTASVTHLNPPAPAP